MIKYPITIIMFSLLVLATAFSSISAIHFYKQQSSTLVMHGLDQNYIFTHILSGKTDAIKESYINNLSDYIVTYNLMLDGDGRLEVLWGIKNLVVEHDIKIDKASSDILANLPAAPLSACQIEGKCELNPCNKFGFPVKSNQSLHGSGLR